MFGKASLILVVGFGIVFGMYQTRLSRMTARATDTFNLHYVRSYVHEATNSGMNMAVQEVWQNGTDSLDHPIYTSNCTTDVKIRPIGSDTVRVDVTSRSYVIVEDYFADHNAPMPVLDSSYAIFSYEKPVSRWFSFTNTEATHMGLRQHWTTKDTIWGPLHTNGIFYTFGSPTFYGKVTAYKGIQPKPRNSPAQYYGGWEIGVETAVPTDMTDLIAAASMDGGSINEKARYDDEIWLEFLADGTVRRAIGESIDWSTDPALWDTLTIAEIAPTNVITTSDDIHVKGTLNGQVTLLTTDATDNIYIDDDLVYAVDPTVDVTSDDLLGLVSMGSIVLSNNTATNDGCEIHACMVAVNGSFYAEDWDSIPVAVDPIRFVGSMVQNYRGPVGDWTGNGSWHVNGFDRDYHYDPRLQYMSLPWFPTVRQLYLASWWE